MSCVPKHMVAHGLWLTAIAWSCCGTPSRGEAEDARRSAVAAMAPGARPAATPSMTSAPRPSSTPAPQRASSTPPGSSSPAAGPAPTAPPPERISTTVRTRTEWIAADRSAAFAGSQSVLAVRRALDPGTGKAFDPGLTGLGGDPRRLRRGFRLDRADLLLGEPLLVELRVEVPAGAAWLETVGGNYRGRGRDDNFLFVLRHADGTLSPDAYPGPAYSMGGISTRAHVTPSKPFSYTLAVQRYAAIMRSGTYDLYCLHLAHGHEVVGWRAALEAAIPPALRGTHRLGAEGNILVDRALGKPTRYEISPTYGPDPTPSPLGRLVPADVAKRVGAEALTQLADFAHFRVSIREGSAAERRRMVARWTQVARHPQTGSWPTPRDRAASEALWFARRDDFLPVLARWLAQPAGIPPQDFHGLALHGSRAATALLLRHLTPSTIYALHYLPSIRIPEAVPTLIGLLTHADATLRAIAAQHLSSFTGQRLGMTWDGYRHDRPTLAEGRQMQPAWEAWWRRSRAKFLPAPRKGF